MLQMELTTCVAFKTSQIWRIEVVCKNVEQ
jgi:hypothetical protein